MTKLMMPNAVKNLLTRDADSVLQDDSLREFDFSPSDFSRVKKLIYAHAGISLNDTKQSMVYSRLARRLRATGKKNFTEYLNGLEQFANGPEWEHFVNSLTTNLTSFYREAHHFPILTEHLKQVARFNSGAVINIWCSAASTGEEPYTLAMTACEAFGMNPPVRILATDIDTNVLQTAQQGIYSTEQIAKIDPTLVKKYFLRGSGVNDGSIKIRQEVANLVSFRRLNLLEENWALRPGFDAIFCRNVMIYFDKPTQLKILSRFAPLLNQGGLLFVGHSENFTQEKTLFTLRGKTVYEVASHAAFSERAARHAQKPGGRL